MTESYKSPEVTVILNREEIRRRYQDTAMVIFEEQQVKKKIINYLSFGNSRRTMEYSNNGNHPVIIRKPADSMVAQNSHLSLQILKEYHKSYDKNCAIT